MAFFVCKIVFFGFWVFQWLSERVFFFLENIHDVIEIIGGKSKICDGMLHLSCFMGKINLFGLNLSGFWKVSKIFVMSWKLESRGYLL